MKVYEILGLIALVAGAGACAGQEPESPPPPPFRGQEEPEARKRQAPLDIAGTMSAIRKPRSVVVRSEKELEALWKEHARGDSEVPKVDFKKYDVAALFAGEKTTGGYSARIDRVVRTGKSAVVHATITSPAPGSIVTMALTSPFAMRAVEKLPANVRWVVKHEKR